LQQHVDADAGVRLEAARALEATVDADAIAALGVLLDDPDEEVAEAAVLSLSEILDPRAAPALLELLVAVTGEARAPVLAGLRRLRAPAALEPSLQLVRDISPVVRREAIGVLAYLKDERALAVLAACLQEDTQADVRLAAAGALAFASSDEVLPALSIGLSDPDWQVRQESAITLGKLLQPSSIPFLVQALADPAWEVRLKAANALGALKAKAAVRRWSIT